MIKERKIQSNHKPYLYSGAFDISDDGKIIDIILENGNVSIDLNHFFGPENNLINDLSLKDITGICNACQIKATIFPNGSITFRKLDSSKDELTTCFLATFMDKNSKKIILAIAFDETQPTLYKAELLGVFETD